MTIETATILAAIIAALASFISLIVTAVGWWFTHQSQEQLLKMQVGAEDKRAARRYFLPRRVEKWEELKNWLNEGPQLVASKDKTSIFSPEETNQVEKWKLQYDNLSRLVGTVHSTIPILKIEYSGTPANDQLGRRIVLNHRFAVWVLNYRLAINKALEMGTNFLSEQERENYFFAKDCILPTLETAIDELIEKTATGENVEEA